MRTIGSISAKVSIIVATVVVAVATNSAWAQTGDSEIDSWLAPFPTKAGNSTVPTLLIPSLYTNGVETCNSIFAPPDEGNCPSDLLYTPNANTGGYQAFGVGAEDLSGGTYYLADCYVVYVWDPILEYYEPYIYCNW